MRNLFLLLTAFLFITLTVCSAQQTVRNETLKVTFPTDAWAQTEAPAELREFYENPSHPAKLVFHAASTTSRIRFFVSCFPYPQTTDLDICVAGYLDGLQKRCARQASSPPKESFGTMGDFPVFRIEIDAPNALFLEIRTVVCENGIYSLEINGPRESHAEATQLLDSFATFHEKPLPASVVNSAIAVRKKIADQGNLKTARGIGYLVGYYSIPIILILFLISLLTIFRRKLFPKRPPPLPPSRA